MAYKIKKGASRSSDNIIVSRNRTNELVKELTESEKQLFLVNGPNRIGKDQQLTDVIVALANEENKYNYKSNSLCCGSEDKVCLTCNCIVACDREILREYIDKEHTTLEALGKLQIDKKLVLIMNDADLSIDAKNEIFNKEKFFTDINVLLKNSNVKIVLISRYSMEKTFKGKLGEEGDEKITCVSLGGFDESEKEEFFKILEKETWYAAIEQAEREKIRGIFDKYAGSHPQLLNAIRQQLFDLPEDKRTAEALEQIIKNEIPKDSDSSIFRVYSRMDELLGKEEMVNTEKGKRLSYRDLYISCFSADGRDTGFSEEVLNRYKEELYSKGYALKRENGEYEAITPYMPIYLDKWRVEALEELMTGLDELEDGIRAIISEKLLNLTRIETGGDEDEAWELAEKNIKEFRFFDKKELYLFNNRVEHRLNDIDKYKERESGVLAPLMIMAFEEYFDVLDKYWERPHFPKMKLTEGKYESLFERLDRRRDEPILWPEDEAVELKQLVENIGENLRNSEDPSANIAELEKQLKKLFYTYSENPDPDSPGWLDKIVDKTILNKLEASKNVTEIEEIRCFIETVLEKTKEKCVYDAAKDLLEKVETTTNISSIHDEIDVIINEKVKPYYKDDQGNNIFEKNSSNRDKFQEIQNGAYYTCNSLKELVANNGSEEKIIEEYEELEERITKLSKVIKEVSDYTIQKVNKRRISFNRARNVAKHRNNLDILDVRKYTGLLDDCNAMLDEFKNATALPYYKISEYYDYFNVKQVVLDKAVLNQVGQIKSKVVGRFVATGEYKNISEIPGCLSIETDMFIDCQGDLLLPVAWLEWRWNKKEQIFDVFIRQDKKSLLEAWLPLLKGEYGAAKFIYSNNHTVEIEYGQDGNKKKYTGKVSDELTLQPKEYILYGDIELQENAGSYVVNVNHVITADEIAEISCEKAIFVCQEDSLKVKKGTLICNEKFYPAEVLCEDETVCKGKIYSVAAVTFQVSTFRVTVKNEIENLKFEPSGARKDSKEIFIYTGNLHIYLDGLSEPIKFNANFNSTEIRRLWVDLKYSVNNEQISWSESDGFTFWSMDLRVEIPQKEINAVTGNVNDVFFMGTNDSVQGTIQIRKDQGRLYAAIAKTAPQVSGKYYKVSHVSWDAVQKQFNVMLGDLAAEIEKGNSYKIRFIREVRMTEKIYQEVYFVVNGETARLNSKDLIAKNKDIEVEIDRWDEENRCWWVKEKKSGPTEEEIAAKKQKEEEIKKLKEKLQNTENTILKPEAGQFYIFELVDKDKNKGTFKNSENKVSAQVEVAASAKNVKLTALNTKWVKVTNISSKGVHTIQKADELFGKFISGVRKNAGENETNVDEQLDEWLASLTGKGKEFLRDYSETDISLNVLQAELPKLIKNALYHRFAVADEENTEFKVDFLDQLNDSEKEEILSFKDKTVSLDGLTKLKSVFLMFNKTVGKKLDFLKWLYEDLNENHLELLKECILKTPSLDALKSWIKWIEKVPEEDLLLAKTCDKNNVKSPKDLTKWLDEKKKEDSNKDS